MGARAVGGGRGEREGVEMCVQPDFGGQRFALRQDVRQLGRDSVDARAAGSLRYQITPILD